MKDTPFSSMPIVVDSVKALDGKNQILWWRMFLEQFTNDEFIKAYGAFERERLERNIGPES